MGDVSGLPPLPALDQWCLWGSDSFPGLKTRAVLQLTGHRAPPHRMGFNCLGLEHQGPGPRGQAEASAVGLFLGGQSAVPPSFTVAQTQLPGLHPVKLWADN